MNSKHPKPSGWVTGKKILIEVNSDEFPLCTCNGLVLLAITDYHGKMRVPMVSLVEYSSVFENEMVRLGVINSQFTKSSRDEVRYRINQIHPDYFYYQYARYEVAGRSIDLNRKEYNIYENKTPTQHVNVYKSNSDKWIFTIIAMITTLAWIQW